MRRLPGATIALVLVLTAASTQAGLVSKQFEFKPGVTLAMDASTPEGLRIDSVRFKMPPPRGDRLTRTGGLPSARVAISNTSERSLKIGLAIALFDGDGRLLAVASGGSRLAPIKAGRQRSFSLVFEGVQAEAHKATEFRISLESKP